MLSLAIVTPQMGANYYEQEDYWSQEAGPAVPSFFGSMVPLLGLKNEFNPITFQAMLEGRAPDGSRIRAKTKTQFSKNGAKSSKVIHEKLRNNLLETSLDQKLVDQIVNLSLSKITSSSHLNDSKADALRTELHDLLPSKSVKVRTLIDKHISNISKDSDRAGLDMTFSAPKSVSLAVLIDGNMEVLEAHMNSIKYTLDYLENNFIGNRQRKGSVRAFNKTNKMIGAMFHHGTSRAKDPQLHTHAVLMNSTYTNEAGFSAIHNDEIYKNSVLLGTIYQKKLADILMEKGYEISPRKKGSFELVGYSKETLDHFSKRKKQIDEILKRESLSNNAHDKRIAVLIERARKEVIPNDELSKYWNDEFKKFKDKHPKKTDSVKIGSTEWRFAVDHLTEGQSVWTEQKLLLHTIQANMDASSIENLLKGYRSKSKVTFIQENDNEEIKEMGVTDARIIRAENNILDFQRKGRNAFDSLKVDFDIDDYCKVKGFYKGQADAVKLTVSSKDRVIGWHGVAGSGKSYALKSVSDIAKNNDFNVIGLAQDGNTSKLINNDLGIKSYTIDSFLLNYSKMVNPAQKTLYVLDEAGKVDTETMNKFLSTIEESQSRVVLVGDTRQIGAVGGGSPFNLLKKYGMSTAELLEHNRQKNKELLKAVQAASEKSTARLSPQCITHSLQESENNNERLKLAVKKYMSFTKEERKETLLMTDLNSDREEMVKLLRESLRKEKSIGASDHTIPILVKAGLSHAQTSKYWSYEVGDVVIPFKDNEGSLKKSNQYTVEKINYRTGKILLKNDDFYTTFDPKKFNDVRVYKQKEMAVSVGESIQMTANYFGLQNRQELEIKKIEDGKIFFKDNNQVLNFKKNSQFIDYSEVKSTYSTQGKTSERAIILANSSISSETWYVGISRAKHEAHIVTDSISALSSRLEVGKLKDNALDNKEKRKYFKSKPLEVMSSKELNI